MTKKNWNRAKFQAENDHRYHSVSGELCIYCGAKAILLDHVPALYQVFKAGAYPVVKVPACWACNEKLGAFAGVSLFERVDFLRAKTEREHKSDQKRNDAIHAMCEVLHCVPNEAEDWARVMEPFGENTAAYRAFLSVASEEANRQLSFSQGLMSGLAKGFASELAEIDKLRAQVVREQKTDGAKR